MTNDSPSQNEISKRFKPILYPRRWFMLFIFCICSMSNSYQWLQLTIIPDQLSTLWNQSIPGESDIEKNITIDWLSMIFMLSYIPLVIPGTFILNRFGLRIDMLIATILNFSAVCFKSVGVFVVTDPSQPLPSDGFAWTNLGYPLLMTGQTLASFAQVFILGIPAQLAATWFGHSELATTTALGVFGNQLGVAFGFCIPPLIVPPGITTDFHTLKTRFEILIYGSNIALLIPLLLVLFFFQTEPPSAPSFAEYTRKRLQSQLKHTRAEQHHHQQNVNHDNYMAVQSPQSSSYNTSTNGTTGLENGTLSFANGNLGDIAVGGDSTVATVVDNKPTEQSKSYISFVFDLARDLNFILLITTYGILTGVYYVIGTLLNPILDEAFPHDARIGWVGFVLILAGIGGSVLAGIILDKTKKYKMVTLFVYFMGLIWMVVFTATLHLSSISLVFICSFFIGFFMTGYLPLGFEFAAELTYPIPEGLTSGIINAVAQLIGIIATITTRVLNTKYNALTANIFMTCLVGFGLALTFFINEDLKRSRVQASVTIEVNEDSVVE